MNEERITDENCEERTTSAIDGTLEAIQMSLDGMYNSLQSLETSISPILATETDEKEQPTIDSLAHCVIDKRLHQILINVQGKTAWIGRITDRVQV